MDGHRNEKSGHAYTATYTYTHKPHRIHIRSLTHSLFYFLCVSLLRGSLDRIGNTAWHTAITYAQGQVRSGISWSPLPGRLNWGMESFCGGFRCTYFKAREEEKAAELLAPLKYMFVVEPETVYLSVCIGDTV